VPKARGVLLLQLGVGAIAAAAVVLALIVGVRQLSWDVPSAEALVAACRSLLPDLDPRELLTVGVFGLSFTVLVLTVRAALRRMLGSRRLLRTLTVVETRTIAGTSVVVFEHRSALAFCAGLLRPRVYLSTATLRTLTSDELEAVVAHERHHARQRDPLRVFVAGVLSDGLFFVPALRKLGDRYAALAELAADRAAVQRHGGDPGPLASALLAFEEADPAVVGIAPERVDGLLGEPVRWNLPVALLAWAVTLVAGITALALRVDAVGEPVSLALVAAQSCMLLMAALPIVLVGWSALGTRRLALRPRRG
jgi:hypothetical protein